MVGSKQAVRAARAAAYSASAAARALGVLARAALRATDSARMLLARNA